MLDKDGFSNAYTIADPSEVILKNNALASQQSQNFAFQIHVCNPETSLVECASDSEIDEYL